MTTGNGSKALIYDASGRMMPQQHVSNLPKGLYIIREGNRTRKILVSK